MNLTYRFSNTLSSLYCSSV